MAESTEDMKTGAAASQVFETFVLDNDSSTSLTVQDMHDGKSPSWHKILENQNNGVPHQEVYGKLGWRNGPGEWYENKLWFEFMNKVYYKMESPSVQQPYNIYLTIALKTSFVQTHTSTTHNYLWNP